jgi:hypothetical protein
VVGCDGGYKHAAPPALRNAGKDMVEKAVEQVAGRVEAGFQPLVCLWWITWAGGPGWYGAEPLALGMGAIEHGWVGWGEDNGKWIIDK